MVNEKCYYKQKGILADTIDKFNSCCRKFNEDPDEQEQIKLLMENGRICFSFAAIFTLASQYTSKKDIVNNFLEEIICTEGEAMRLVVKNSIVLWNKYGFYLTVFPYELVSGYRKTVIVRIKDNSFDPISLSMLEKEISIDGLLAHGLSQKIYDVLRYNDIESYSWQTNFALLRRIKGISRNRIRQIQEAIISYCQSRH